MPPKPSKIGEKAESEATIGRADLIASLAEHRSALLSELKTLLKEVNDKLDVIQATSGLSVYLKAPKADNPVSFFSQLLRDVFGHDTFPSAPELDRAHRSLAPKPGPGGRPRPVILYFHRYQNKELVVREARKRGDLKYRNILFRIYEDYPPEVVGKWKEYRSVMSSLYKMGLKPSLLYPARLRITQTDGT